MDHPGNDIKNQAKANGSLFCVVDHMETSVVQGSELASTTVHVSYRSHFRFKIVFLFSPYYDSFRWVKDGKEFKRELFESGTLTAEDKEELRSYQGSYRCYVANELGTAVSDLAQLITERESLL